MKAYILNIWDVLSAVVSANLLNIGISTTVLIIATITLYISIKERKERLESSVKESFLKNEVWTNAGVFDGKDSDFFNLHIDNPYNHIFKGEIKYISLPYQRQPLVFFFEKINGKNITIRLKQTEGYKDFGSVYKEFGSAKAKLKFINPDLFEITFSKGCVFKKGRFKPDLPHKTQIIPDRVNGNEVSFTQNNIPAKILTNDIIDKLSPNRNYAKVKELLGEPDKIDDDSSIFDESTCSDEELKNVKYDMYFLNNANLKITRIDEEKIHSITVLSSDNRLTLPRKYCFFDMDSIVIGEAEISEEILENALIQTVVTRFDDATAIQNYMGQPFNKSMTYFVSGHLDFEEKTDFSDLIGRKIIGFCLCDSDMAFYIYDSELL